MTDLLDFMECDTCRALPGSPPLCSGCLHNRDAIGRLRAVKPKRDWPGILMFCLIVGGIVLVVVGAALT